MTASEAFQVEVSQKSDDEPSYGAVLGNVRHPPTKESHSCRAVVLPIRIKPSEPLLGLSTVIGAL